MNGFTRILATLCFVALLVGAVSLLGGALFLMTPASDSDEEVIFEVKPTEPFKSVAKRLESEGLIKSAKFIEIYARLTGASRNVRVGEYAIRKDLRPKEVLAILSSGKSVHYSITISEGLNRFEIADLVERQKIADRDEFLNLTTDRGFIQELLGKDLESLEGYLFPETYHITKYTGARGLIKIMVDRFKENFARAKQVAGWSLGNLTEHQLVTLASIIEKETGAPEERPVISSVFHNRLRKNMLLQTDPTIIYGIWNERGSWNGSLSRADLKFPSKYNTYLHRGLPPGPIANPGFEALKAAGAPAESDYLFFVSRNDGTHVFSREYRQHAKAVEEFQLNRRAREGKSWRDLKKRQAVPEKVVEAPPAEKIEKASATKPTKKPKKKKAAN